MDVLLLLELVFFFSTMEASFPPTRRSALPRTDLLALVSGPEPLRNSGGEASGEENPAPSPSGGEERHSWLCCASFFSTLASSDSMSDVTLGSDVAG